MKSAHIHNSDNFYYNNNNNDNASIGVAPTTAKKANTMTVQNVDSNHNCNA